MTKNSVRLPLVALVLAACLAVVGGGLRAYTLDGNTTAVPAWPGSAVTWQFDEDIDSSAAINPASRPTARAAIQASFDSWESSSALDFTNGADSGVDCIGLNDGVNLITFDPGDPEIIYISDYFTGVHRSTDGGQMWQAINDSLFMREVTDMALSSDGLHLYAATEGGGVYRLDLNGQPPNTWVEDKWKSERPDWFKMLSNFPNPFNMETHIGYSLQHSAQVKIQIFNLLGKEIVTLVDEEQKAGDYCLMWNGLDRNNIEVSSGVYIMRYLFERSNGRKSRGIKKMMLIK